MSLTSKDKEWLRAELNVLESKLTQRFSSDLEAMGAKLLTEFHKWAGPTEVRLIPLQ